MSSPLPENSLTEPTEATPSSIGYQKVTTDGGQAYTDLEQTAFPKSKSSKTGAIAQGLAVAQLGSGHYLQPVIHQRRPSVNNGQQQENPAGDVKSLSSKSSKSTLGRLKKKVSHFFQDGSRERDPEITAPTTATTTSSPSITTSLPPTATATSISATVATPTMGASASFSDPLHQVEVAVTEVESTYLTLNSDSLSHSSPSNSGNMSLNQATIPVSKTSNPIADTSVTQLPLGQHPLTVSLRNDIFPENIDVPSSKGTLPRIQGRVESTPQLAFLIGLLRAASLPQDSSTDDDAVSIVSQDILNDVANRDWVNATTLRPFEQKNIQTMPRKLIAEFIIDPTKDLTAINEIVLLGPVLEREEYRTLLNCFIEKFDESRILRLELLQGLVHLVQSTSPGFLDSDDLIKILTPISARLQDVHQQSSVHPYHLTLAVSRILDVMAKHKVKDLDRVTLHEPLSAFLLGMKESSDPYLMYQACYAFQALQYVPEDETVLETFLRHSTGLVDALIKISGLVQLNFGGLLEGLKEGQKVIAEVASTVKSAFEGVLSLFESGRGVVDSVREGLGAGHKRLWYLAVRGAAVLVREGRLVELNKLILEAPCRRNPLFQMGICQLLGEIAEDEAWEVVTRKQAVEFIGELYQSDQDWGLDESVKQWMWTILCRISRVHDKAVRDHAFTLVCKFRADGYTKLSNESPLRSRITPPQYYPLLSRVQNIPDVEADLRRVADAQLSYHWDHRLSVYIPPQAKGNVNAADSDHSPLMEEVKAFLKSERQVLLIRGDSGAGKTTFNHKLAYDLWKDYIAGGLGGSIPLFINLPELKKLDEDMITEVLKSSSYRFNDTQIKELEQYREFILVCDGYDERQLDVNLHTTNCLNQPGHWKAKLIVSCRSQYLKKTYLYNFQPNPSGRPLRSSSELYQEAVIIPFTEDQIEAYVKEFVVLPDDQVLLEDRPKWSADDYMTRLRDIPNLISLVGNPFLLSVSLQVLHLIIGDTQDLSSIRVTGVQLYDIFVDKWMDRGQKRLQDRLSLLPFDQKTALRALSNDHKSFSRHAINYMKNLATSIFEEQAGNPAIEYSQYTDKDTWKGKYFSDSAEISLFREASPIVGTGTQYQFLHRSMLEYFYSLDFFDPGDAKKTDSHGIPSYEAFLHTCRAHKLTKKSIVGEPLVVQFLGERARMDPDWKQMLLVLMDTMETAIESIHGAKNAIAILLEAGISVNGVDLHTLRPQWYSST